MSQRSSLRLTSQISTLYSARSFSSTSKSLGILDYFKFYNKKPTTPAGEQKSIPTKKTKDVIEEIESKEEPVELKPKIEILGRSGPRKQDKQAIMERLNGFTVNKWIPKESTYSKSLQKTANTDVNYTSVISTLLQSIARSRFPEQENYNEIQLTNLYQRFEILKNIQIKFGLEIPDIKLSQLDTLGKVEEYLKIQLNPSKITKDELLPADQIQFTSKQFEGTNVSVGDWVFEKEKSKKFKKLLKTANKLEKKQFQDHQKANTVQSVNA